MRSLLLRIRYSSAIMLVIISILLLILALAAIIYGRYQVNENNKAEVTKESIAIVSALNMMLDEAADRVYSAKNSIDSPCPIEKYNLNKLVSSSDWVRSITLVHNKRLVCSSFFDEKVMANMDMSHYIGNELQLSYTKFLKPVRVLLGYNIVEGDWNIFANMNAMDISKEVPQTIFSDKIYLLIGGDWLTSKEQILFNNQVDLSNWLSFKSDKYPFELLVDYPAIEKMGSMVWISAGVIIVILIIGLLVTFYIVFTAPYRDLRRGLANNEFVPYYQLITYVEEDDNEWHGAEVLIRWQHPKKGLLLPGAFIELAESSDIIIEMTKKLMDQVAEDLSPYIHSFSKSFYLSFNIHTNHLKSSYLLDDCKRFLSKFPANNIHLALELSERQLVDKGGFADLLKQVHEIGVTVAVDDFGTGYSNLGYLQLYSIDYLKIDRMFVSKICHMNDGPQLIDAIINLAKTMNMRIVAEGVENHDQLSYLKKLGVEYIQGFLFSKPLPINDTVNKLFKLA